MTPRQRRAEDGYTITEMMVAFVVLVIVMTMTYLIAGTLVRQSVKGTLSGESAATAQSQINVLDQYLRGAISPASASTEYSGISSLCGGSGGAVQASYDYYVELCTAPASKTACTSSNATSTFTACPQLYILEVVTSSTCNSTYDKCTLEVVDQTATGHPVVWSLPTFRCTSTCQDDLGTGNGNQKHGASPSFPYLFTYFTSGGSQTSGATPGAVQGVGLDVENLTRLATTAANQRYTELTDTVWLTGAATPAS